MAIDTGFVKTFAPNKVVAPMTPPNLAARVHMERTLPLVLGMAILATIAAMVRSVEVDVVVVMAWNHSRGPLKIPSGHPTVPSDCH